jgi:hypothetical protein
MGELIRFHIGFRFRTYDEHVPLLAVIGVFLALTGVISAERRVNLAGTCKISPFSFEIKSGKGVTSCIHIPYWL